MTDLCIKCLQSEITDSGASYSQFLLDSLRPSQGVTIGTFLRRILLSDLEGSAITAVRIAGITHEFSTLKGVREDILEILLNLKGIIFKKETSKIIYGRLKIEGPAVITANSIQLPPEVKIINPTHYIATIANSSILEMELRIESGKGYRLSNQMSHEKYIDYLQIDACFTPVTKVDFQIETVYDKSNEITERLILDIWTNGSLSPEEAISKVSKFVINMFSSLLENGFKQEIDKPEIGNTTLSTETHTNIPIEELELSVRAYNCLKRTNINTISDLLKYSPEKLQEIKNFGQKSANEVYTALKEKLGITFN